MNKRVKQRLLRLTEDEENKIIEAYKEYLLTLPNTISINEFLRIAIQTGISELRWKQMLNVQKRMKDK